MSFDVINLGLPKSETPTRVKDFAQTRKTRMRWLDAPYAISGRIFSAPPAPVAVGAYEIATLPWWDQVNSNNNKKAGSCA